MNEPVQHIGILLIEHDSALRKSMRKQLEEDGHAVLAVNSMGEALARLRMRHYEFVLCTNRHGSRSLADDYGILIDQAGLLARSASGYEVYLPGIGIDARAVLIMPTSDPQRVSAAVREIRTRLERTSGPVSARAARLA
jgi:ActR/RegA family two-component response regulator